MPLGRLLWLVRPIGLPCPPVPPGEHVREQGRPSGDLRGDLAAQEPAVYLRRWAAWLSLPFTEVLVLHDHVIAQQDGELVASGFLLPRRTSPPTPIDWNPTATKT